MRRTQIYIHEEQDRELERRAAAERTTKSALIRRAIGRDLQRSEDQALEIARLHAAVNGAFGAVPSLVDGSTYVDRIRGLDEDREAVLAAGRRRDHSR